MLFHVTVICGEMDVRHTEMCVMFGGLNDFLKVWCAPDSEAGFTTG